MYFRYKIIGRKNLKLKRPYIIAMNHPYKGDIFALNMMYPLRRFCIMSDESVFKKWYIRFFLRIYAIYPMSKSTPHKTIEDAAKLIKDGNAFAIPSEGTISKNGEIGPFRSGTIRIAEAAGGEVPIIPLYIGLRKSRLHRQKVAIGEPVLLKDLCPEGADITNLTSTEAYSATVMLRELVVALEKS